MVYPLHVIKKITLLSIALLFWMSVIDVQAQAVLNDYLAENLEFEEQQKALNQKIISERKRRRRERRKLKRNRNASKNKQNITVQKRQKRAMGNFKYQEELAVALDQEGKDVYMFDIVKHAKKYLGIPYKWGGETPSAFDCSGFTQYVFKQGGYLIPRVSRQQAKFGKRVRVKRAEKGDLIFFGKRRRKISHVGLVISDYKKPLTMIHASSSKGIQVTDVTKSRYWRKRLRKARRVIGVR